MILEVNLHDVAFAHLPGSSVHGKASTRVKWVRGRMTWSGITIFTDAMLTETGLPRIVQSRVKVGWLIEPREYVPERYRAIPKVIDALDLLLTHDQELLDTYPAKARFVPFGGCWIPRDKWGMHPKTERVVQILSGKRFMPGHHLRHEVMARFPEVACHGWGSPNGQLADKESILAPAAFAVVIENSRARNFFTEKLLDCFAVGTIPIYWGAPNIADFFNRDGIVPFDSADDLNKILLDLRLAGYEDRKDAIADNLERMKQYEVTEDWIAEHILEAL